TDQQVARHGGAAAAPVPAAVVEAVGTGHAMLHARVTLADDTLMPAVRAYMVIAAAADMGTVVASAPEVDDVEAFDGRRVDVWVAAGVEAVALSAALTAVPDVATAEVAEVAEAGIVGEPDPGPVAPVPVPVVAGERGEGGRAAATVRVDAERLDQLMHLMGELVVQRTQVEVLAAEAEVPGLSQAMADLTRCSHALQAIVMQVRMIPVEAVFLRFPRLVRDLSTKFGKHVELELVGQDTELDRTVVDALGDPLVHLVRNALDHGLETPTEREAAGKPPAGTVRISARHAGGNVVITVADDGRGVDRHAVAAKAVRAGLIAADQAQTIDIARAIELLFTPGFSTRDHADDISGRGVGMDAVRAKVRELGGEVLLTSEPGQGTTAQIRLPLTLAIMNALLVRAGGRVFGIALDRIDRTVRLVDHAVRSAAGQRMLVVGDTVLPLYDAAAILGHQRADDCEFAVIVQSQERSIALAVSTLIGQRELVTRPLPADLAELAPVSGAAVLSDGEIALLVDCDALVTDTLAPALRAA
ncbi:MAG TPA: chemotaxis protein CheA, partial [Solirubrobacteraceae bacterium]